MKKTMFTLLAAVAAAGCQLSEKPAEPPKVSVFSSSITKVAKQNKVTTAEAIRLLKEVGVTGFDSPYSNAQIPEYIAAGLKPANLFGHVDFLGPDNGAKRTDDFIAAAVQYGAPRIMVVPDFFTLGGDQEAEYIRIRTGLGKLVHKARAKGLIVTVEDFGAARNGARNPCSYAKYLKRFMDDLPDIGFALDSGNLYYAGDGEDIRDMMRFAGRRIRHVHLKDLTREDNHKYASLGEGAVPNEDVVKGVAALGYDDWWTLENLVGADTLADARRQVGVLRGWLGR